MLASLLWIFMGQISREAMPWVSLAVITTALGVVQPLLRDRQSLPAANRSLVIVHAGIGEVMPILLLSFLQEHRSGTGSP